MQILRINKGGDIIGILENSKEFFNNLTNKEFDGLLDKYDFEYTKPKYKVDQKIRFYDVRGYMNFGIIKAIKFFGDKVYYQVYANNFMYEITEKEIKEIR